MPSAPIVASATAPLTGSVDRCRSRRARRPAARWPPPTRPLAGRAEVGGPATSTSSTTRSGRDGRRSPPRSPACAPTRSTPAPVRRRRRRRPAAAWARAARRPRGRAARARRGRAGRPAIGRRSVTMLVELAAEGAAVGERRARLAAGLAPGRVRLEVRRLDPGGAQRGRPVAGRERRAAARASTVVRRPCTLPATARASASVSPPPSRPAPSGTATSASSGRGVVGEAALAEGDLGSHRLRAAALDRGARRGRREVAGAAARRSHGDVPGVEDRAPPRAPAEVRQERLLDGGVVGRLGALGPQALEPADDARRAEPALARARGAERVGPARPSLGGEAVDGGDRSSGDPPSRGDARDPGLPVDQHRAATALALGAAAVLRGPQPERRSQHVEQRSAVVVDLDLVAVDLHLHLGELTVGRPWAEDRFAADARPPAGSVSRRQFLLGSGAAAGAVLLGGCGGNDVGRRGDDHHGLREPRARAVLRGLPDAGGRPRGASAVRGRRMPRGCSRSIDTPEALTVTLLGPTGDVVIEADRGAPARPGAAARLLPAAVHRGGPRHLHRAHRDRRRGARDGDQGRCAGRRAGHPGRGRAARHRDAHSSTTPAAWTPSARTTRCAPCTT